jgi:hypothetical protein
MWVTKVLGLGKYIEPLEGEEVCPSGVYPELDP